MVVASNPKADWLKMVSNPPVVAVFVDANRRISICKDTCMKTSVPEKELSMYLHNYLFCYYHIYLIPIS